jgi:hypothetical protein
MISDFFRSKQSINRSSNNEVRSLPLKVNHEKSDAIKTSDDQSHQNHDQWWTVEERTGYTVMRNFIISDRMRSFQNGGQNEWRDESSVTYTTQASYEFFPHAEQLCRRFDGPISIAVYAPGSEVHLAVNLIYHLRECAHQCVRNNVSWHMVFDAAISPPSFDSTKSPDEMLIEARFNMIFDCAESYDKFARRMQDQLFPTRNAAGQTEHVRQAKNLPYPINVLRNVARLSAPTRHVLASDIELYPSINIVSMFGELWQRQKAAEVESVKAGRPQVYVLPIFEVESNSTAPETKPQLSVMLKAGSAIFFHKWVCDSCQSFVNRDKWIQETANASRLNIFRRTQRKRSYWEPLYIGTNDEPLYEERMSWNGKRDKMSQVSVCSYFIQDIIIIPELIVCFYSFCWNRCLKCVLWIMNC